MTSAVGAVGPQPNTIPVNTGAVSTPADASTLTVKPLQPAQDPGISPHIIIDPLAGVITQFLNSSGQVQSQIPSSAVVAYLRDGLGPDGRAKPSETAPKPTDGQKTTVA